MLATRGDGRKAAERARRSTGTSTARRARERCTRVGARRGAAEQVEARAEGSSSPTGAGPSGSSAKSASCPSASSGSAWLDLAPWLRPLPSSGGREGESAPLPARAPSDPRRLSPRRRARRAGRAPIRSGSPDRRRARGRSPRRRSAGRSHASSRRSRGGGALPAPARARLSRTCSKSKTGRRSPCVGCTIRNPKRPSESATISLPLRGPPTSRPASATMTTLNSRPFAPWIVSRRTASAPSSSATASSSLAPSASCSRTKRMKPGRSVPRIASYWRASRPSFRRFANRREPSQRASTARS